VLLPGPATILPQPRQATTLIVVPRVDKSSDDMRPNHGKLQRSVSGHGVLLVLTPLPDSIAGGRGSTAGHPISDRVGARFTMRFRVADKAYRVCLHPGATKGAGMLGFVRHETSLVWMTGDGRDSLGCLP